MSTNATIWAWSIIRALDKKPSYTARLVFLALADRHNQNTGYCFPSVKTIAIDTGLSKRSVQNSLRELEGMKLVKTHHRKIPKKKRNHSNQYAFLDPFRGARGACHMVHEVHSNLEQIQIPKFRPSDVFDLVLETEAEGLGNK